MALHHLPQAHSTGAYVIAILVAPAQAVQNGKQSIDLFIIKQLCSRFRDK